VSDPPNASLVSIDGVPIDEWRRRKALPIRPLTKEDAPLDDMSERLKRGLQVAIDDQKEWDWILSPEGMEVGILQDNVIHWYQG